MLIYNRHMSEKDELCLEATTAQEKLAIEKFAQDLKSTSVSIHECGTFEFPIIVLRKEKKSP